MVKTVVQYILHTQIKNNLYGRAMIQYLQKGKFKWVMHNEISKFNNSSIQKDSEEGYKYPKQLHDLHNEHPLVLQNVQAEQRYQAIGKKY